MGELRQLLVANCPNIIFLSETNIRNYDFDTIQRRCNMFGCFVVDSNSSKGSLAILWDNETSVDVQSYSPNHVDMLVKVKGLDKFWFTRIYGYLKLEQRHLTWNLIWEIGGRVNKEWVIGGTSTKYWMTQKNKDASVKRVL